MSETILTAFRTFHPQHTRPQLNHEHGQDWVSCLDCGAQWSVVETSDGTDFEQVSDGDGYCDEQAE